MKIVFSFLSTLLFCFIANSATVFGVVKNSKGNILPYASITIKNNTVGTTANAKAYYSMQLQQGTYTLKCQFIGYQTIEKIITISSNDVELNFELIEQQYNLTNVEVKANREDPAYEIMRKTIAKREEHLNEIKKFECDVYIKGQLQLRNFPKNFFGQKVDFEDGDTSKKKMIFLSETVAKYFVEKPKHEKVEVTSTRVSGNSDGLGFSNPQIISFYQNIVRVGSGLNPRGFISPISNNAFNYYKYKFEGTFFEDGKEISRIKVIPKRKFEPLFSGYINIIENEWRIFSVQLTIVKEQQMQLLDTLNIEQLYLPLQGMWVIKQQVIYPSGKFFGFDFFGNFLQVYNNFNLNPNFQKGFFNNVVIKVNDSANKKSKIYWDTVRPVPLLESEVKDYKKKDSLEEVRREPKYLDSIDKVRNKIKFTSFVLVGKTLYKEKKKQYEVLPAVINMFNYNTVEGIVFQLTPTFTKSFASNSRKSISIVPNIRYGFGNNNFNAHLSTYYNFGKKYFNNISFSAGKKVFQFNNAQPITITDNTVGVLLYNRNYMKIYEAEFAKFSYVAGIGKGIILNGNFQYQSRNPLENLTDITQWRKINGRNFTANYPVEITNTNFTKHKAASFSIGLNFRPGTKYAELPNRIINLGSKYPTFNLAFTQGLKGFLNSSVDYSKWDFSVSDNLNLNLAGRINYRLTAGGFINANNVPLQDLQHFPGNKISEAKNYLSAFQLAEYYEFSNASKFYSSAHVQYHLNGLLSNKLPFLKKWNWFFVVGANALYIDKQFNYYEAMIGLENVFKLFRVDFIKGWYNTNNTSAVKIAFPLFLQGKLED